jgi:RNA polymerase sigma-70 factor (ECF subfamily)
MNRSGDGLRQVDVNLGSATDADLLAAIADCDRAAMAELYDRHAPWLLLRLRRRCADETFVEEAVQDTFVTVWQKADTWEGSGEVAAWVWGIGVRKLMNRMRPRRPLPVWMLAGRGQLESVEEQVLLGVEHGDLGSALGQLSPELRTVVQATVLDGLTTREAARLLGVPAGTVKTRMSRARRQMREALT